jgi:hypothetical protein
MALTKVRTGGIQADAVDSTILKLDDNYAFTGNVSSPNAFWCANRSSGQAISQNTNTTILWDTTVTATNVTNTMSSDGRITIPSGQAGWYSIHAIGRYQDGPSDGKERTYIQHYDTSASSTILVGYGEMNTKGTWDTLDAHAFAYLDVGDYVYVQSYQNNDSSADFRGSNGTAFFGMKIG